VKRALILSFVGAIALTGCTERLESDVGCPLLCPNSIVDIQTTTLDAIVMDTTVSALEAPGSAPLMLLASRGDTLDTRVVIRYDSVPPRYRPILADTLTEPIEEIHEAVLRLFITSADGVVPDTTTIQVYNVDSDTPDTAFTALLPLFTPDRLLGEASFPRDSIAGQDSVRIPLDSAALLTIIEETERLRLGVRVSGTGSAQLYVFAVESGLPALLAFRPAADTAVPVHAFHPYSKSPEAPPELTANLSDYVIVAHAPPPGATTDLNVGGIPAQRAYLRFAIPSFIFDSTTVVRATLLLTQKPNPTFPITDTMGVAVHLVLASRTITDIARAATLTADADITAIDTLFTAPADDGVKAFDIASFVAFWRAVEADETPHALVLASTRENGTALEARFYSMEAAPELRPRLRISYSPRRPPGIP
jgi:hypothetical protein